MCNVTGWLVGHSVFTLRTYSMQVTDNLPFGRRRVLRFLLSTAVEKLYFQYICTTEYETYRSILHRRLKNAAAIHSSSSRELMRLTAEAGNILHGISRRDLDNLYYHY